MVENKLTPIQFKVTNFRNIDDSGWIPIERVTAFVGRNESGKTALLKALHKFNPATPEPYKPQREFPRDRFTREFENGADWPVCSVEFTLSSSFQSELATSLNSDIPSSATVLATTMEHLKSLMILQSPMSLCHQPSFLAH
jgi:recombinational DNA repair ATPase RecF